MSENELWKQAEWESQIRHQKQRWALEDAYRATQKQAWDGWRNRVDYKRGWLYRLLVHLFGRTD